MGNKTGLCLVALLACAAFPARARRASGPEKKARIDALLAQEKTELGPLQAQERDLFKRRKERVLSEQPKPTESAKKNKEEAMAAAEKIKNDPAILELNEKIKAVRQRMMEKRAEFDAKIKAVAAE